MHNLLFKSLYIVYHWLLNAFVSRNIRNRLEIGKEKPNFQQFSLGMVNDIIITIFLSVFVNKIKLHTLHYILSSFRLVYSFPVCFTAESASDAISWETSEVISLDIKHHL